MRTGHAAPYLCESSGVQSQHPSVEVQADKFGGKREVYKGPHELFLPFSEPLHAFSLCFLGCFIEDSTFQVETREMLSPNCLVDAEGDIDSDVEVSWPETGPADMQDTELMGNREALDGSQASGCAGQATESCLPEHYVALVATQTGGNSDQAMDQALEPELSEASSTAAATASASDQEPEPRITESTSSSHPVASAGNIQHVARELGIGGACSAIQEQYTKNNDSTADDQDDQANNHTAVTSLTERGARTTTTSPIPHTASHLQHAINKSVAHGKIGKLSAC